MISITVNGSDVHASPGATLSDVLQTRDIDESTSRGVAVALNDKIVRRSEWKRTRLESGVRIEIVTARQGG